MNPDRESKYAKTSEDDFNRPRYPISVIADLLDVHPQTLRLYEREGLIKPQRTARKTRMYSDADVEQLRSILSLTELGVNLAGVEIITRMRDQIEQERARFKAILREIWERYKIDPGQWEDVESTDLIPLGDRKMVRVKKKDVQIQDEDIIESDES